MKTILFKIRQFPHLSETFVVAQIVTALKANLNVVILVSEILDFAESTHNKVIEEYKIEEKLVLEDYNVPKNRLARTLKAGLIIVKNFSKWKNLISYVRHKKNFSLTWIYQFDFYCQFRNIDILHVQYGTSSHPLDILKKIGLLRGQLIVSFHGHDAFFPINGFIENNGYYKDLFIGDNIIVANTPYLAEKLEELRCPPENIEIVPVGVNTNIFYERPKRVSETVRFINIGRLDKIKGQIYAIKFIKFMRERKRKVELIIVGDGPEKQNLVQAIQEFDLSEVVFLVGKKPQEEVIKYLSESDVYLFTAVPLKDGRRETQGLATLEAEACGLPVLAFNSGGIKFTVSENQSGFLCAEYDMECLLEKGLLLLNFDLRQKMGRNAIKFVHENFSQSRIDSIWEKIYYQK